MNTGDHVDDGTDNGILCNGPSWLIVCMTVQWRVQWWPLPSGWLYIGALTFLQFESFKWGVLWGHCLLLSRSWWICSQLASLSMFHNHFSLKSFKNLSEINSDLWILFQNFGCWLIYSSLLLFTGLYRFIHMTILQTKCWKIGMFHFK